MLQQHHLQSACYNILWRPCFAVTCIAHLLLVLRVESEVSPRHHLPGGYHPLYRLLLRLLLHQLVVVIQLVFIREKSHARKAKEVVVQRVSVLLCMLLHQLVVMMQNNLLIRKDLKTTGCSGVFDAPYVDVTIHQYSNRARGAQKTRLVVQGASMLLMSMSLLPLLGQPALLTAQKKNEKSLLPLPTSLLMSSLKKNPKIRGDFWLTGRVGCPGLFHSPLSEHAAVPARNPSSRSATTICST